MADGIRRGADFSPCRRYRYRLTRRWAVDGSEGFLPLEGEAAARAKQNVTFIMLNPSRADARRDDPTIRRCIAFARGWGYGGLDVVNLFAWRTHDPRELRRVEDPVGPENDAWLRRAAEGGGPIVAAWGVHGALLGRAAAVCHLLSGCELRCLGTTAAGHPRHPLYVRADAKPRPYEI